LYLGSLAGHFSFPELVGANVIAGVVIVVVGVLGLSARLVAVLPLPIAMGMFAGSILGNLSELVIATVNDSLVAGATVGGYLLGRLVGDRRIPPVALAALCGATAIVLAQRTAPGPPVPWTPPVVLLLPEAQFSWLAFVAVSLPLVALSVGLGNVQGLGYLLAQGYRVPVNLVTLVVGCQSLFNA
jgi:benzoate membrane transport protein